MWYFQKIDPVQSVIPFKYVAFVGAGGKTSLIEYFASRLVKEGKTVAITTTTKIFVREPYQLLKNSKDQSNNLKNVSEYFIANSKKIFNLAGDQRDKNENLVEINLDLTNAASSMTSSFAELEKILSEFKIK